MDGFIVIFGNPVVLKNTNKLSLYITLIILTCVIAKVAEFSINSAPYSISRYFQYPVIIPFMSILLALFINEEIALFTTLFLTVVVGFTLSLQQNYFIVLNMFSGVVAALLASRMKKRKEIFFVCFKIFLICVVTMLIYRMSIDKLVTDGTLWKVVAFAANLMVYCNLIVGIYPYHGVIV